MLAQLLESLSRAGRVYKILISFQYLAEHPGRGFHMIHCSADNAEMIHDLGRHIGFLTAFPVAPAHPGDHVEPVLPMPAHH